MDAENTSTNTEAIPNEHTKMIYIKIFLLLGSKEAKEVVFLCCLGKWPKDKRL